MENLRNKIKQFLTIGDGYGSGYGSGYGFDDGSGSGFDDGYGSGYGSGFGSGDGSGDGSGSGSGSGYGSGSGSGSGYGYGYVKTFQGQDVYSIDGVATLIDSVHDNYAKGHILRQDFSTVPCFIAKVENRYFAHGKTLRKAFDDALAKAFRDLSEDERVAKFKEKYADPKAKIPAMELFEWHNKLTGSCEMGRRNFVLSHCIDLAHDSFTVDEFVKLTANDYGGQIIRKILS